MAEPVLSFGSRNFTGAELGDERRSQRLPQLVDEMQRHPGGSLPEKLPRQADLEAFYRLCDAPDVTHAAVIEPHRQRTLQYLQQSKHFVLSISDATELDYTTRTKLAAQLGQIGKGTRRGLIVQNTLVVAPTLGVVVGLANQVLHQRPQVPKEEKVADSRQRESRESRLWICGTEGLPARREVVGVYDRGADAFEFLEHEVLSGRTFVTRASHDRCILLGHSPEPSPAPAQRLQQFARSLPAQGDCEVLIEQKRMSTQVKRKGPRRQWIRTQRTVRLNVAFAPVQILPPKTKKGEHGDQPLPVWIVRIWEAETPQEEEPVEWILITNHPIDTVEAARLVKTWYEWRWTIEELHKAMKTGCDIEDLQFQEVQRLEPAIGILSILALSLLMLRDAARHPDAKNRRATDHYAADYVRVLCLWRHRRERPDWSLFEFSMALARLGGHQGNPTKKPPGWIVLWRGWEKLQLMVVGARLHTDTPN